jgi:hypothetical protein
MLNSQHRQATQKNNALPTGSPFNYFFVLQPCRRQPTLLPIAIGTVCKHFLFLCCPFYFTAGNAAAWRGDATIFTFIFWLMEIQSP